MSRLGKKPVIIPKGVELKISGQRIEVKGPKGQLTLECPEGIVLREEKIKTGSELYIDYNADSGLARPKHGLYRSLVGNLVTGVSDGFEKKLSLVGVGYRATVSGKALDLQLGFSHPLKLEIPEGITVKVDKNTQISVQGTDKRVVGQFAADIRSLRPPEPYKGKGVRYTDERVRRKAGKAAKGK